MDSELHLQSVDRIVTEETPEKLTRSPDGPVQMHQTQGPPFVVMGANLDTGNLGVNALFASTVKCILHAYPDAEVSILEGSRRPLTAEIWLNENRRMPIGCVGVRCNKTPWRRSHVVRLILTAVLARLMPIRALRNRLLRGNPHLRQIVEARCVADITGGDSFSDIYGLKRLAFNSLYKLTVLAAGTELVLLPQTYGPFKGATARWIARWILRRAGVVLSRDRTGPDALLKLMGSQRMRAAPEFSPDVAFVLESRSPEKLLVDPNTSLFDRLGTRIGFNVSGLLWNGGYTGRDMFGLGLDYQRVIVNLTRRLLSEDSDATLLLVPHVLVPAGHIESDADACRAVRDQLHQEFPGRVFVLAGEYDESEVKHVIGRCQFFLGSRMHACIAATSQCIPTASLAYSKKFKGVFASVGVGDTVIDLASSSEDDVVTKALEIYGRRESVAQTLREQMPEVKRLVIRVFEGLARADRRA